MTAFGSFCNSRFLGDARRYNGGMVTITGSYSGELRCESKHGPSGASLITDPPIDNHGKGSAFSPTDLVATALATCIVTTIAIWAGRQQIPLAGMTYTATKEMTTTAPRRIARLGVTIVVPGEFDAATRERMIAVAHACPVHQSLHESVALDIKFEWKNG